MPELELEYMVRSIALDARIPIACGIPEFKKGKGNPPPHMSVVAVVCSPFHCTSISVDMYLIESLDSITSYVKNSNAIVLILRCLNALDDNMFLFAACSTSIHPNINIEAGLTFLTLALDNLIFKVEPT